MSFKEQGFQIGATVVGFLLTCVMTLSLFITNGIKDDVRTLDTKLSSLDNKVLVHLTNHDIHIPREQIVSKAEFQMQCNFDEKRSEKLDKNIEEIKFYMMSKK